MAASSIMKGAEPWGSEGDQTGVLVLHGFTGSPQSVRYWAEGIAKAGRTVLLPRLPGHGTVVGDLQSATAAQWVAEAEMSLRGLRERCHQIFVCGLSMGATITLDLAERFADEIDGIVVVNPSVFSKDPRRFLAPLLGKFPLLLPGLGNDVADPNESELCYDKIPTKAAAQVLVYQERVKRRLSEIKTPALIFVSRQDHTVHPSNGTYVHEHISSANKELVWLERSYHVATIDHDRDLIVERTVGFIDSLRSDG